MLARLIEEGKESKPDANATQVANRDWLAPNTAYKKPNILKDALNAFQSKLPQKDQLKPEDILHYIYAILYSGTYRNRYNSLLRIQFPRIPITSEKKLFNALAEKG